nr:hypothetical protein MACL_00002623 [Theileria orientalis]
MANTFGTYPNSLLTSSALGASLGNLLFSNRNPDFGRDVLYNREVYVKYDWEKKSREFYRLKDYVDQYYKGSLAFPAAITFFRLSTRTTAL